MDFLKAFDTINHHLLMIPFTQRTKYKIVDFSLSKCYEMIKIIWFIEEKER